MIGSRYVPKGTDLSNDIRLPGWSGEEMFKYMNKVCTLESIFSLRLIKSV